jgi:hypothetical protein
VLPILVPAFTNAGDWSVAGQRSPLGCSTSPLLAHPILYHQQIWNRQTERHEQTHR